MAEKSKVVLSLGAALASLTGMSVQGAEAKSVIADEVSAATAENTAIKLQPNAHYQVGEDLLGFVMTKQADGTIVAQHALACFSCVSCLKPLRLPASPVELAVDFDSSVQSLGALDAAVYRLIGTATCRVDRVGDRYVCRLAPTANPQKGAALKSGRSEGTFPEPGR